MRWADIEGRRTLVVNGKLVTVVPNPTYDPVGAPGSLERYFRAENFEGAAIRDLVQMQPIRPEYREHAARVAVMDEQGVQLAWLLPSLGLGLEEMLLDDTDALYAVFRAYNALARRRLGLRPRRPHPDRPDALAARPGRGRSRSGAGHRARRALRQHAARAGRRAGRAPLPRRPRPRPRVGDGRGSRRRDRGARGRLRIREAPAQLGRDRSLHRPQDVDAQRGAVDPHRAARCST